MTLTPREDAKAVISQDVLTGREIVDFSKRNAQVAYMLGRTGTQSHLFGLVRFLDEHRGDWTRRPMMRGHVIAGVLRATHALTDPAGDYLFKYERHYYTPQELLELDPPRPKA